MSIFECNDCVGVFDSLPRNLGAGWGGVFIAPSSTGTTSKIHYLIVPPLGNVKQVNVDQHVVERVCAMFACARPVRRRQDSRGARVIYVRSPLSR